MVQVNATSLLGASIRYFGVADNELTGTLPAYLSASTLPQIFTFSIELQVSIFSLLIAPLICNRVRPRDQLFVLARTS